MDSEAREVIPKINDRPGNEITALTPLRTEYLLRILIPPHLGKRRGRGIVCGVVVLEQLIHRLESLIVLIEDLQVLHRC